MLEEPSRVAMLAHATPVDNKRDLEEEAPQKVTDMTWMSLEDDTTSGKPSAKTRAVGNSDKDVLITQLNHLKLTAQLKQEVRLLMSAVFWVALVPLEIAKPAIDTAKKFADKTRGVSKHNLGQPHPQVWRALLNTMITRIQATTVGQELKQYLDVLVHYYGEFTKDPLRHMCFIKQARVREVKDGKATVHWSLPTIAENAPEIDRAIMECMVAVGGDVRAGTVAANPMERKLQQDIDSLNARLGKGAGKGA